MKKRIFALGATLLTALTLSSCSINNVTEKDYSNSVTSNYFSNTYDTFIKGIENNYSGDFSINSSYSQTTTITVQYEDKEETHYTSTEKGEINVSIKLDLDNEIYTNKTTQSKTSKIDSEETQSNYKKYEKNKSIVTTDGNKTVYISEDDKTYFTSDPITESNKKIRNFDKMIAEQVPNLLNLDAYLNNAKLAYFYDNNNTYTISYTDEEKGQTVGNSTIDQSTATLIQVVAEDDKITYYFSDITTVSEKVDKVITTTVEEEKKMVSITYKDNNIKIVNYVNYECLDEEE